MHKWYKGDKKRAHYLFFPFIYVITKIVLESTLVSYFDFFSTFLIEHVCITKSFMGGICGAYLVFSIPDFWTGWICF